MKKRIFNSLVASALAASILLLSSCGEDDTKTPYGDEIRSDEAETAFGCHYYIPEGFSALKQTHSEFNYSDGVAYFYINPYNPEQLTEMEVDPDITVYAYTRLFMAWNDIPYSNYTYDEETDTAYVEYVSDFGAASEGMAPEYFRWKIMRNTYYLYIVTVNCPVDVREKYQQLFDEVLEYTWVESIADVPVTDDLLNPVS